MKRIITGVAAALLLSAGPAAADGLPTSGSIKDTGIVMSSPIWTGFYVGAGIGAGAVVHDLSVSDGDEEFFGLDGIGGEGLFGTIAVGYDHMIVPGWVGGVFADYDFGSGISTDVSFGDWSDSIDQEYAWAVGARLGFLANPGTLIYGTAGYTQTEFDFLGLTSEEFGGYFVGAGVETFLRPNWTLKLEYRFAQYDSEDLAPDYFPVNLDIEPSEHTARLVLSYKLGHR